MSHRRISLEGVLVLSVAVVWAILAAVYHLSPSLGMPGYVRVWGAGAVVFLALTLLLFRRAHRATRPEE